MQTFDSTYWIFCVIYQMIYSVHGKAFETAWINIRTSFHLLMLKIRNIATFIMLFVLTFDERRTILGMPTYFPRRCFECGEEGGDILKHPLKSKYATLNRANNENLSKMLETFEDILAERKLQIQTKAEHEEPKRYEFFDQLVNKISDRLNKSDVMDVTHSVNIQGEMSTEEFRAEPKEAVFYNWAIPPQVKYSNNSSINRSEEQLKSSHSASVNELCPEESQRNIVLAEEINKNKRFPQVSMIIYELESGDKYDESCTEEIEDPKYSEDFTKAGFFLNSAAPRIVSESSCNVLEGTELESLPDTDYSYSEARRITTASVHAFHTETAGRRERSAPNENNVYTDDKSRINKSESVIVIDNLPFQLMNIPFLRNSESRKKWSTTNLTLPKAESFSSLNFVNGCTDNECVNHPNAECNNHFHGSFVIHPETKKKKRDENGFEKRIQWGIKPLRVTDLKHIYKSMIMNSNVDPPFYILFQTTKKSNENRISHFIKYNAENEKPQGINLFLTTQRSNESIAKPSFHKYILNPYESHNYNLFLTTTKPNNKDSLYYNKYKNIKIDKVDGSILQKTKGSYEFPMIQMLPLSARDNGFIQDPNLFLTVGKTMKPIYDDFESSTSFLDNYKPDNLFFTTKTPKEIFGIKTQDSYEKEFFDNCIPKKGPFLFNVITQALNNENEDLELNDTDIDENNVTACCHVFDSELGCIEEKRVLESTTKCPDDAYTNIESNEMEMFGQSSSDNPNVILQVDGQRFENTTLSDKHNESNQGAELHFIDDRFNLSQREIIPLKLVPLSINHFCKTVTSDLKEPTITVTNVPIEVEKPFHQSTDKNFNKLGVALCFFFSTLMPEFESRSTSENCQDSQSERIFTNNNIYYIHPDFVNETNTSSTFDNKKLWSEVYPKNKSITAKITSKQRPSHKPIPIIIEELEDALENPQEVYGDYYYHLDSDEKSDQNKQDNDNEMYSRLTNNKLRKIKHNPTFSRSNQYNINPGIFSGSFISSEPKKTLSQFKDFQNDSGLKSYVPSSKRTHSYYDNGRLDLRRKSLNCKNNHCTKQPFLNDEKFNNGHDNDDTVNYITQDPNEIYVSQRRIQLQKMPDLLPWELQNANIKDSDEFYQYNNKKITDEFSNEFFEDHSCRSGSLSNELNEENIDRPTGAMKSLGIHFTPVSYIGGNNPSYKSSKSGKVYATAHAESFSTNTPTAVSQRPKSGISLFFENLFHNRRTTKDTNANQNVTESFKNVMNSKTAQSLLKNGLDIREANLNSNNKSYIVEHYLPEFQKMKREKRTPDSKKADKHKPPVALGTQRLSRMFPRSDRAKLTEPENDFNDKFQSLQKDLQDLQNSIMTQSKQLPDKEKNLTLQIRVIVDVVNNTFSPDFYDSDQLRKRQAEKMEKLEKLIVPNTTEDTIEIIPIIIDHDTPLKEDKLTRGYSK